MWENTSVKLALALCDKSGAFLFQVRPDLFPHGRLTDEETHLWSRYYEEKEKRSK